jgi:Fic family protein
MPSKQADNELVKKVLTFKSGNVPFSRNVKHEAIANNFLFFEVLLVSISQVPILPALAAKLESELIRRAIFGTAAIEGNPLSEERVGEIIGEPSSSGLRVRAEQEIVNLKEAYQLYAIPQSPKGGEPLAVTEALIRDINERVTRGVGGEYHAPGQYRDYKVAVGNANHGGAYTPPKVRADIEPLMAAFVDWLNSEGVRGEPTPIRAALAHYHLALIHPFGDGNGRTARLLEVAIMAHDGYKYVPTMLSNYYYKNIDAYYMAFRECERSKEHDMTPFLVFFSEGLKACVFDLQNTINGHIRLLALGDHYRKLREQRDITQRQHDLLMILLQNPEKALEPPALRTDPLLAPLYRKASEATPRRDLKRLQELRVLVPTEDGGLRLNAFTLG